jgi:hypothetical protein
MMARDPAQRYQTPAEVAAALAPFAVAGAGDLVSAGDTIEYCANTDSTSPGTVAAPAQPGEAAGSEGGEFDLDGVLLGSASPLPPALEEALPVLVRARDRERRRGLWKLVFLTAGALSALTGLITLALLVS